MRRSEGWLYVKAYVETTNYRKPIRVMKMPIDVPPFQNPIVRA